MNKYALTLPLLMLSVFLGYFGSALTMEHIYEIATLTAAGRPQEGLNILSGTMTA